MCVSAGCGLTCFTQRSIAVAASSSHADSGASTDNCCERLQKQYLLMQDSLSGDSKTVMLVNVNPTEADAGETACSLGFASRVRGVELGPAKKHIEAGAEVQELKGQLDALRQQVGEEDEAQAGQRSLVGNWSCPAVLHVMQVMPCVQ